MKYLIDQIKLSYQFKKLEDLDILGIQILKCAFITIVIACLPMLPYRLITLDYTKITIISIGILTSIVGLWLINIGRILYAHFILSAFVFIAFAFLFLYDKVQLTQSILVLSLYSLSNIFIIKNKLAIITQALTAIIIISGLLIKAQVPGVEIIITLVVYFIFFYTIKQIIEALQEKIIKENQMRKQLNNHLVDKNKQIQLFSTVMAHDIKAPLRSIKGFSSLIQKELKINQIQNDRTENYLDYIHTSVDTLQSLVEDLLIQSKIDTTELVIENINTKELVELQLSNLRYQIEAANVQIKLQHLGTVQGDKKSLMILFANLLSNAIKYQPQNDDAHIPAITITQETRSKDVILIIADNGIGIAQEFQSAIFNPFRRLHGAASYEGNGLGLSICKSIVEKHSGRIELESELNKGSTFRVFLPRNH